LGIAYLLDSLAVSLPSEDIWNFHQLYLNTQWLEENGELDTKKVQISHAAQPDHIPQLAGWISSRLATAVADSQNLWGQKHTLFPHLTFCEAISAQICPLHRGTPLFRQIVKRIFEIEVYCVAWHGGPFQPEQLPFKATVDSEATLRQYETERTFSCQEAGAVTFSWHGRLTPAAWRIYFDPAIGPGRMRIGYRAQIAYGH